MDNPHLYEETIRDLLEKELVGATIVGLTQHDKDEWMDTQEAYAEIHLSNGIVLRTVTGLVISRPNGEETRLITVAEADEEDNG